MNKTLELLNKYNSPGSRYTYFPTHLHWNNELTSSQFLHFVNTKSDKEVDVYVHIPFCHSLCAFCGLNVKIMKSNSDNLVYINRIIKEWSFYPKDLKIKNLYLGGGTPNFLNVSEIEHLISSLSLSADSTITMEIDPRSLTHETLDAYKKLGIKKLIFGIQDFNQDVLNFINRKQNNDNVISQINYAYKLNFEEITLEFIYGLPKQSFSSFKETMQSLKNLNFDSVYLYPYAKVPWQNSYQKESKDIKNFSLFEMNEFQVIGHESLLELGLKLSGMGHYTKKDFTYTRNIMGMGQNKKDTIIGLGVSAISTSPIGHLQNDKIYDRYMHAIKENNFSHFKGHHFLEFEFANQSLFEDLIMNKKAKLELIEKFKNQYFDEIFNQLVEDQVIKIVNDELIIDDEYSILAKSICQMVDKGYKS